MEHKGNHELQLKFSELFPSFCHEDCIQFSWQPKWIVLANEGSIYRVRSFIHPILYSSIHLVTLIRVVVKFYEDHIHTLMPTLDLNPNTDTNVTAYLHLLFHLQQADLSLLHRSHTQSFIRLDRCSKTIISSTATCSTRRLFSNKSEQNRIKDVRNPKIRLSDRGVNIRAGSRMWGLVMTQDSGQAVESLVIHTDPEEQVNFRPNLYKWRQWVCPKSASWKFRTCGKQSQ